MSGDHFLTLPSLPFFSLPGNGGCIYAPVSASGEYHYQYPLRSVPPTRGLVFTVRSQSVVLLMRTAVLLSSFSQDGPSTHIRLHYSPYRYHYSTVIVVDISRFGHVDHFFCIVIFVGLIYPQGNNCRVVRLFQSTVANLRDQLNVCYRWYHDTRTFSPPFPATTPTPIFLLVLSSCTTVAAGELA